MNNNSKGYLTESQFTPIPIVYLYDLGKAFVSQKYRGRDGRKSFSSDNYNAKHPATYHGFLVTDAKQSSLL